MRDTRYENGFTLVELLIAMAVTGIVLTAAATLAYAVGTVNDATDDTAQKQAQLRCVTVRISELIRHSRLVCGTPGSDLALWLTDDNSDGQININELVYIDAGPGRDRIRLYECNNSSNPVIALSDIDSVGTSWWLGFYDSETYTALIPQCGNVQFHCDASPPDSEFVGISFELIENDTARQYQINAALRCRAGHLLNGSGDIAGDDDHI